jgi:hypothetical protein
LGAIKSALKARLFFRQKLPEYRRLQLDMLGVTQALPSLSQIMAQNTLLQLLMRTTLKMNWCHQDKDDFMTSPAGMDIRLPPII